MVAAQLCELRTQSSMKDTRATSEKPWTVAGLVHARFRAHESAHAQALTLAFAFAPQIVHVIEYSITYYPKLGGVLSMKCPFCGGTESRVKDSRDIGDAIHRRRECEQCKGRFSTYERVEKFHLMVIKRDQRREPFDREKLYIGIRKACEKRPLPVGEIENAVEEIEQELYRLGRQEIQSSIIGEMVMERLRNMDKIAYIRFASVYRSFGDVETMFKEIQNLLNRDRADANEQV